MMDDRMKAAAVTIVAIALLLTSAASAGAKETNPLRKQEASQLMPLSQHQHYQQQQPQQLLPQSQQIQGMKTRQLQTSTATAVSSSSSTPCSFCPTGLEDPELVLPDDSGTTCLQAQEYAATLFEGDDICPTLKFFEELCCPTQQTHAPTQLPTTSPTSPKPFGDTSQPTVHAPTPQLPTASPRPTSKSTKKIASKTEKATIKE